MNMKYSGFKRQILLTIAYLNLVFNTDLILGKCGERRCYLNECKIMTRNFLSG